MKKNFFGFKLDKKNICEVIFLALAFLMFLYISIGSNFQFNLEHNFPVGYKSQDAYFHESLAEYVHDEGDYRQTPPFYVGNTKGLVPVQPPFLYYIVAYISTVSSFQVYDILLVFLSITMILSCFLFYSFIKRIDPNVAILSVGFMVTLFVSPFISTLAHGQFIFTLGMFFFFLSIFFLLTSSYFLLFVSISAMVLTHTAEFIYFLPIFGGILIYRFIKGKRSDVMKAIFAMFFSVVLTFDYLVIFYTIWIKDKAIPIKFHHIAEPAQFPNSAIYLKSFGIFQLLILAGMVLAIITLIKKRKNLEEYFVLFFLFIISMGTYLNQWRAYQFRFFWPITLSFFFGLAVYSIAKKVIPNKRNVYYIVSLLIILSFLFIALSNTTKYVPSYADETYWTSLVGVDSLLTDSSKVLVIDGAMSQHGFVYAIKTVTPEILPVMENKKRFDSENTSEFITTEKLCLDIGVTRKDLFNFVRNEDKYYNCRDDPVSICTFEYIILNFRQSREEYVVYWMDFLAGFGFEHYHFNDGIVVMKNNNVRTRC